MSEMIVLPDGTEVATGLNLPTEADDDACLRFPLYSSDFFLDPKDIEKSLKGDQYKAFRRLRSALIINQGSIGKCTASATANAYHNTRQRDGMPNIALADAHLYMNINGGRDNGSVLVRAMEFTQTGGIAPVQVTVNGQVMNFPLTAFNRNNVPRALLLAADAMAKTYQSFEPYRIPTTSYSDFRIAVASALARDHQIVFAVHAGRNFGRLHKGYIQQSPGVGNHAVLAHSGKWVGGQDLVHPDVENSWGPAKSPLYGRVGGSGWGEDGFGLSTMDSMWQCARKHVFWVFTGSKVNPGAI